MAFKWKNIIINHRLNTDKMIKYINKYGVNTKDMDGYKIFNYFYRMSNQQIKIVIRDFDCDFRRVYGVYYPGHGLDVETYIFKTILKHDRHLTYLTHGFNFGDVQYCSLIDYLVAIRRNYNTYHSDHLGYRRMCARLDIQIVLFANYRNKNMTLFMLMLSWLEESDKIARFQ